MTPEHWQTVKRLVDESAGKSAEELPAWLDDVCGADAELRHEVESLLAYEADLSAFSDSPAHRLLEPADRGEDDLGRLIGPYRIREILGRGGMGAVYLAEREEGFEQRVALKLVAGPESRECVWRFHRERQILARLEHPNITRLLDGGTSDDGRSYFAMELVEGIPIDRYCARHRLPSRRRILLVVQVCDALQFAHRNLVVHRDLKPSNILVTKGGVVKLLDFGIAKPLAADAGESTELGQPMTLRYASPEQLRDEPITTASDIYSLGVVLYELLTGRLPLDLGSRGGAQAVLAVCEEEPLAPAAAILKTELVEQGGERVLLTPALVASQQATSPARLYRRLAGDLDAVVLKTLRKDPAERYASADRLAADLLRHLDDLPVQARHGAVAYRLRKYVRRHRWAVALVASVVTVILLFTVALARQLDTSERERHRAERLSGFLVDLFRGAEPDRAGQEPSIRELIDRGRERLETELMEDDEVRARLLLTLGEVYGRLGHFAAARESLEAARVAQPRDGDDSAVVLSDLGAVAYERGEYEEAEELYRQSIAIRQRLGLTDELIKPRNGLARIHILRGELEEAEEIYREGLEWRRARSGARDYKVASSLLGVAMVLYLGGDFDAAEPLYEEALGIRLEAFDRDTPAVASVLAGLGRLHHARRDLDAAERLYGEALDILRRRLGSEYLRVATLEKDLAALLVERGELDTAGVLLNHALSVLYRDRREGDWTRADAESVYGAYLAARGRLAEAEPCLRNAYETLKRLRGPDVLPTRQARRRLDALEGKPGTSTRQQRDDELIYFNGVNGATGSTARNGHWFDSERLSRAVVQRPPGNCEGSVRRPEAALRPPELLHRPRERREPPT